MKIRLTLILIFFSTLAFSQDAKFDPTKVDIYVTPFFNSSGPVINVGSFSKGLSSKDTNKFLKTITEMKTKWTTLSIEELYVASIRLYDLSFREESIYWFYSAQMKSRLYLATIDKSKMGGIGSPAFEFKHAQNSFFQLIGPYINGYAFTDIPRLIKILEKVKLDLKTSVHLKEIYPKLNFITSEKLTKATKEIHQGLDKYIDYLTQSEDKITKEKIESGQYEIFKSLINRKLPLYAEDVSGTKKDDHKKGVQKNSTAEEVVKQFYIALFSKNKDAIVKLIVPHPNASILWEGDKSNQAQPDELIKIECREYKLGEFVLGPSGQKRQFPDPKNKDIKIIIPYMDKTELRLPTIVFWKNGAWKVNAKMLINARLASRKAKQNEQK